MQCLASKNPTIEFANGPRPPQPQDFELWIGDPAEIKAKRVRKQKYDREAKHFGKIVIRVD
jgi:hypothetical protein